MNDSTAIQAPTVSVPSLASSAMLVELSISVPTMKRKDKAAAKDIAEQNGAEASDINASKDILGGCVQLKDLQNWQFREVRQRVHYSMTKPWSDSGLRIITTINYPDYINIMSQLEQEFWQRVQTVLDVYDWEIIQAQTRLGNMFNAALYPTKEELCGKFKFNLTSIPLPDAADFRVDLPDEAVKVLKEAYERHYNDSIKGAMDSVLKEVIELLTRFHKQLDRGYIAEGTLDQIYLLLDTMRTCNLTQDTQIEAARLKLEEQFRGLGRLSLSKEALKEDDVLRAETKSVLEDVIKSLPTIDM